MKGLSSFVHKACLERAVLTERLVHSDEVVFDHGRGRRPFFDEHAGVTLASTSSVSALTLLAPVFVASGNSLRTVDSQRQPRRCL